MNIVYRDIKPENILLAVDGHVRIADFGLSKVIPPRQRSYSFCGSPEYMSPEMLACIGHDNRLDIYCLGALLFEMLTGLPPFYVKDNHDLMYQRIMREQVELPLDFPNKELIGDLIARMMTKEPQQRYQTLAEVKAHPWLREVRWNDLL
jgi:serum/glucocorticoid-regulated kinase 2